MALHIEDAQIEALARALSEREGVPVEDVVRDSLQARQSQAVSDRRTRILKALHEEIWPTIPAELRRKPISKADEEALIGLDER